MELRDCTGDLGSELVKNVLERSANSMQLSLRASVRDSTCQSVALRLKWVVSSVYKIMGRFSSPLRGGEKSALDMAQPRRSRKKRKERRFPEIKDILSKRIRLSDGQPEDMPHFNEPPKRDGPINCPSTNLAVKVKLATKK